ncbi:nuclear transcription factor Y subunit B-10-like [Lycium ferocissimum]|uniref:nuclear transcription factor Y subunit B-10-like n=1 Tax=Lycium ferocissimum TaxID=112874 RepID=UPI002815E017|nr:nuclear transcription factor Y subunit B-10-like [Lycium ferocissimum]
MSGENTVNPASDSGPSNTGTSTEVDEQLAKGLQDLHLPVANVTRIMRRNLPQHAKVTMATKETVQKLVTRFINHITKKANERCQREQRKTVTAEDLLWAMNELGLSNYVEPLTLYLYKYREQEEADSSLNSHRSNIVKPNFELALAPPTAPAQILPISFAPTPQYSYPHYPPNGLFFDLAAPAMMNGNMTFRNRRLTNDDGPDESSNSSSTNYGLHGVKDPYEQWK